MLTSGFAVKFISLGLASVLLTACIITDSATTAAEFGDCDVCPRMVEIPVGDFLMGSEDGEEGRPEGPVHEVSIKRQFALARTETTVAEFRAFVDATDYQPQHECRALIADSCVNSLAYDWTNPAATIAYNDDSPVVCVSWHDAVAYVNWLRDISAFNYRLPSESEWEYATRGGSDDHATLAPVGERAANPFGLYDILGNVWEWTADCYSAPYPARADPEDKRMSYFGFRVARSLSPGQ